MPHSDKRRAFALADLVGTLAIAAVLAALALASLGENRRAAELDEDLANLNRIGAATGAYASDNADAIWTYTWRGGETYLMADEDGNLVPTQMPDSDIEAAVRQMVHILRVNGGRVGEDVMPIESFWFPHARYTHLVLQAYIGEAIPSRWIVSSADRVRLNWQDDPAANFDDGHWLPLQPDPTPSNKRWPYSSSYSVTASTWDYNQTVLDDAVDASRARQGTVHAYWKVPADIDLTQRSLSDVAYPASKVHVHDTHQRHFGHRQPYFGLAEARVALATFDGGAAVRATGDGNPGWHPNAPTFPCLAYWYEPDEWEPPTTNGEWRELAKGSCRWTRGGLKGRDFGGLPLGTGQADPGDCDL